MSLFISNQTAGALSIPDLGITLVLGESYDLTQDRAVDIAISLDLPSNITAGNIAVLDPLDDVTPLSPTAGVEAVQAMNDAHYRIRGGRAVDVAFDNSGTDNAGTDLQAAVVNNSGKVQWLNEWQQQTYEKHDMVIDGDWTMIANAQTTDRAAPQADGPLVTTPPTTTTWTTGSDISVVKMVHKYTTTEAGWGVTLRIRTAFWDIDVVTRITIYNVTSGDIKVLNNPILKDDDWTTILVSSSLIPSGTNFEIWYEYFNSSDANSINGGWTSSTGTIVPADKTFRIDSLSAPTQIRFDYTDLDNTDRSTELDGVTVGSIIHISETGDISRSSETEVTAVDTSDPTSVEYTVSLIHNGPKNIRSARTCTVRIDVPVTAASVYNVNTDYWVTGQPVWATVSSELYYDGVLQADVNDAYGIEVSFQKASISADWDYVSSSGGGGAGGDTGSGEANTASNLGGGSGIFAQKNGVDLEFKSLTVGTGISITPSATELQITNTLPNQNQNLWETINSDSGSTAADSVNDSLLVSGGTGVSTSITGDTLTITNDSPNVTQNLFESFTDGANTAVADTATDTFTFTAGAGITAVINVAGDSLTITNTSPNVDQNLFETVTGDSGSTTADTTTDTLIIAGGTSISTAVAGDTVTITNDAPNVDQNLWETISADSGSATANTTTDTFTVSGGTSISTSITGDILTITNDSPNVDQNIWETVTGDSGSTTANTTTDSLSISGGTSITTAVAGDVVTITNDAPNIVQNLWETITSDAGSTAASIATDTLTIAGGASISTAITGDTLTITNDSPNVDQSLFATVTADTGSTTANIPTDTLTISGGVGITTAITGDTLTITGSGQPDQNLWATFTGDTGTATANTTTDSFDIGGTTDQITTAITGDALAIALAANTVIPGTEGIDIPSGTTGERPTTPTTGVMRFNTTTGFYEAWDGTEWVTFGSPAGTGVKELTGGQLAHLSGTTTIPYDNTPPLITEGTQFFTHTITTQTDPARIVLWFSSIVSVTNANRIATIAIYRDNVLIGVTAAQMPSTNSPVTTTFIVVDTPGTAGTYTYSGRIGVSASATWRIGGFTSNANYGGAANTNNQYVLMRVE